MAQGKTPPDRWPAGKLENDFLVSHFPTGPTPADSLYPQPFSFSLNRTFHLSQKPDTLICYQQVLRNLNLRAWITSFAFQLEFSTGMRSDVS